MTTDLRDGGPRYLGVIDPSDASRNAVLVTSCDAVIAVGGSPGTLIDMGYALKASKPLAVISGWSVVESGGSRPPGVIDARTAEAAVAAVLAALRGD
jgi:hypothetical protein